MSNLNNYFLSQKNSSNQYYQNQGTKKGQPKQADNRAAIAPMNPEEGSEFDFMIQKLIEFDSDPTFGPCKGIPRSMRWQTA